MAWGPKDAPDIRRDVIVFDGDCVLCSRMASFVHRHEPAGTFAFTDVGSPVGQALAARFGVTPEAPETFIVIRNGRATFKSDAALTISDAMPAWRWPGAFRIVPRVLRDALYDWVARNRYRWFGRKTACALADPALRKRILSSVDDLA